MTDSSVYASLTATTDRFLPELIEIRRDLHAHPELSNQEVRTTTVVARRLEAAGILVRRLPGSGLIADLGPRTARHRVALRADLDALPVHERTGLDWTSTIPDVCHACGHDLHTTVVLGAGLVLHQHASWLAERELAVRLLFQPAEEVVPGGAHQVIDGGGTDGVNLAFAVHADPSLDVGAVGLRVGALTAATNAVTVTVTGRGGHTSRPHLTEDVTYALAKVVTDLPGALSRRLDPRAGAALVWGSVHAGRAQNVIPSSGTAAGTLRILDHAAWQGLPDLLRDLVAGIVHPYGVTVDLQLDEGVPPVVNDAGAIDALREAADRTGLAAVPTTQSLGGEDFSWYLAHLPGAMARLGTRTPGGRTFDLHQGDLVIDEDAVRAGVLLLSAVPVAAQGAFGPAASSRDYVATT